MLFLFRRPLLSILQGIYALASLKRGELLPFPRAEAGELLLAALLLPFAEGDLRAPVRPTVWATDASPTGGGIARAAVTVQQAQELYRLREKRGGYSKLELPARQALREEGLLGLPGMAEELAGFPSLASPERPVAFSLQCP